MDSQNDDEQQLHGNNSDDHEGGSGGTESSQIGQGQPPSRNLRSASGGNDQNSAHDENQQGQARGALTRNSSGVRMANTSSADDDDDPKKSSALMRKPQGGLDELKRPDFQSKAKRLHDSDDEDADLENAKRFCDAGTMQNPTVISGGSFERSQFGSTGIASYKPTYYQPTINQFYYGCNHPGSSGGTESRQIGQGQPHSRNVRSASGGNRDQGSTRDENQQGQATGAVTQNPTGVLIDASPFAMQHLPEGIELGPVEHALPHTHRPPLGRVEPGPVHRPAGGVANLTHSISSATPGDEDCITVNNLLFYHPSKLELQSLFWVGDEHGVHIEKVKEGFKKWCHAPCTALRMNARRCDIIRVQFFSSKPREYDVHWEDTKSSLLVADLKDTSRQVLSFLIAPVPNEINAEYLDINYSVRIYGCEELSAFPRIKKRPESASDIEQLMDIIKRLKDTGLRIEYREGDMLVIQKPGGDNTSTGGGAGNTTTAGNGGAGNTNTDDNVGDGNTTTAGNGGNMTTE